MDVSPGSPPVGGPVGTAIAMPVLTAAWNMVIAGAICMITSRMGIMIMIMIRRIGIAVALASFFEPKSSSCLLYDVFCNLLFLLSPSSVVSFFYK